MAEQPVPARMDSEAFLLWAEQQPPVPRYELLDGEVCAQAHERLGHARLKGLVYRAFGDAIRAAALDCEVLTDGVAVRVDARTVVGPDCLVRCGQQPPDDALAVTDPAIVVETRSPSTASRDAGWKLETYFRIASLRHYVLLRTDRATAIHHRREAAEKIATRIVQRAPITFDPPGFVLQSWWPQTMP